MFADPASGRNGTMRRLIEWFKDGGERGQLIGVIEYNGKTGCENHRRPKWIVKPLFAWYDFWVGVFIDQGKRKVYIFPLPCVGLVIYWG